MKLNTKNMQGVIKKAATVFNNDSRQSRMTLTVQANIKTLIDVRPSTGIAFRGIFDQQTEKVIDLVGGVQPFHILKVESSLEDKVAHKMETVEDGKHYQLKVSNTFKQGNYNGYLKLTTDLPRKPEIVIRVTGSIEGEIAVKPQTVLVGKLAAQQPSRLGKVLVVSNREKPFQITKLTYDETLLKVTQEPLPKEHGYTLEITPILDSLTPGERRQTKLAVETDATPSMKYEVQVHLINSGGTSASTGAVVEPTEKNPPPPTQGKAVETMDQAAPPASTNK